MAACGWYPDPSGARGRFRYWDGGAWSAQTTTNPRDPAPRGSSDPRDRRSSGRGWAIGLVVLVLLTVVAVVVVLSTAGGPHIGGSATEDTNSSTPTVSAWDETSTPTPTTPPPPTDTGGVWVDCPASTGHGMTKQPAGRVAAAGFSFAEQSGYTLDDYYLGISMVYDGHTMERTIPQGGGYWSDLSIGLIGFADGFTDMTLTATQVMQCWSMTYHPADAPPVPLIAGEPMTITGHAAWHIQWEIDYTRGEPIPGETLDVIVVDMGAAADYFGVFISCRPLGRPDFDAAINGAIASLRVD